jgi:Na+-driven multidrug efflux pump
MDEYDALEDSGASPRLRPAARSRSRQALEEERPPYSFNNEMRFFFRTGVPLGLAATLEWGIPPIFAMIMAGQTPHSALLQSSLGYGRVFFNILNLMPMWGGAQYFATVLPGAVGAGRQDRIAKYLLRSLTTLTCFMLPVYVLNLFSSTILQGIGVPNVIASQVQVYTRLMCITCQLLMVESHLELIFVNLGYTKSAAVNSLITGLFVDIVCSWFFIYKWDWGIRGVAYAQIVIKLSRILFWVVLMIAFQLTPLIIGADCCCCRRKQAKRLTEGSYLLNAVQENEDAPGQSDPLFTWKETRVFRDLALPSIANFFTSWLIFELQLICVAHIAGIPQAALAAGAVWVQIESTLAAVQTGWLQATKMRVLNLMGMMDGTGAWKSYTILCTMSFLMVAVFNCFLFFFSNELVGIVSNDEDVRFWLKQVCWVLIMHSQTRICSINATSLLIPMKKGSLNILANVVAFYLIASPIVGVVALTNYFTKDIGTKLTFCVSATTIAQVVQAVGGFIYISRCDWDSICNIVHSRANTDVSTAD